MNPLSGAPGLICGIVVGSLHFEEAMRDAQVEESSIQAYLSEAREAALQRLRSLRDRMGLSPIEASVLVQHGHPAPRIVEQE